MDSAESIKYKEKVCIVTGGAMGIGEGCARVFVKNGAKVVICDKAVEIGKSLAIELTEKGPGEAMFISCDVTEEQQIKSMVDETVKSYGRIDCLINNVGIHPAHQSMDDTSAEDFRHILDTNLISYFLASKYALPHLRKTEGVIINTSSLVGMIGQAGAIPYVTTKGAISAMTRALAIDEAKYNVRVNAFSPSNIWTPMWDGLAEGSDDRENFIKGGRDSQLLGRFGTMEEAGNLCLFLATDGSFLTGVDIPLSGGAELSYGRKTRRDPTNTGVYD